MGKNSKDAGPERADLDFTPPDGDLKQSRASQLLFLKEYAHDPTSKLGACKRSNLTYSTLYYWEKNDPWFEAQLRVIQRVLIEQLEEVVFKHSLAEPYFALKVLSKLYGKKWNERLEEIAYAKQIVTDSTAQELPAPVFNKGAKPKRLTESEDADYREVNDG